jgi:hypothetical protein
MLVFVNSQFLPINKFSIVKVSIIIDRVFITVAEQARGAESMKLIISGN